MSSTAARLASLRTDGYTVIERVISPALVAEIKNALAPWLKGELFGRNDFEGFHSERVYALLAKAPILAALVEHDEVLVLVDRLLPPHYLLSALLAINVHPGENPQDFHVDDGAGGFPFRRPRPWVGVSTIWALDDFTESNGATEVVPGSHLWSDDRTPDPGEPSRDAVKVCMPAGSVVVFLGNLLHRGGAHHGTSPRLGITPQYCAPWMRQIENMVLAVPPTLARNFSQRVRALVGYSVVEPGFMGYVDGVHPMRLVDPDYRGQRARDTAS
jgi:ectoine hydroxylase-related dioxygenase (phytanoyl-CoA dioxygenase family)